MMFLENFRDIVKYITFGIFKKIRVAKNLISADLLQYAVALTYIQSKVY